MIKKLQTIGNLYFVNTLNKTKLITYQGCTVVEINKYNVITIKELSAIFSMELFLFTKAKKSTIRIVIIGVIFPIV